MPEPSCEFVAELVAEPDDVKDCDRVRVKVGDCVWLGEAVCELDSVFDGDVVTDAD